MIDDLWYKNAIFYCLNVGTFMDANGDGVGDFEGLMRRLDYLAGLGINTLWLSPFQPSPHQDDGYDTQDYYGVDPRYGTLGDFVECMQRARARGIRVIIDLVINHTSDQHPWFQQARRDPRSKYRHYYCWSKTKPRGADTGMVFPGVQQSTWTYDRIARAYYHHRFYAFQPDLNTEHPAVQEEIRKIMGFWLQLGVSGFRVDAVPFIIATIPGQGAPLMRFDYLRDLHDFLQWRTGDGILLAEANILPNRAGVTSIHAAHVDWQRAPTPPGETCPVPRHWEPSTNPQKAPKGQDGIRHTPDLHSSIAMRIGNGRYE